MPAASRSPSRPAPPTVVTLSPWQQQQAAAIIQSARQSLLAEDPDIAADPQLWLDTLDGESNAIDIIREFINAAIDAEMLADATSQRKAEIATRADRAERRKLAWRTAALNLMQIAGIDKVPDLAFSARVQKGQQYLNELDVAALPADYVDVEVTVNRKPRKDRILADLKAGQSIPGASLRAGISYLVINRE